MADGETGASLLSYRSLKVILLVGGFAAYLVLSWMFAGELGYLFARQQHQLVSTTTVVILYCVGGIVFAFGLIRLLRKK